MPIIHDTAHAFMPYPDVDVPRAPTGPLSGLCFAVKDLFDVAGYPTSGGQPFMLALSGIKTRHADTVDRLLRAGARFVGKTVTDELAFSMNGQNAHFGSPVNGAAPDRITGGSSSGSAAAVSGGLCDFALGTDTGGSVRGPANHCGLVGLRPSHGRVSLNGAIDLAPSFDTCGWLTRDVDTFARVAEVLLQEDSQPLPDAVRVLRSPELDGLIHDEVWQALAPAVDRITQVLGAPQSLPGQLFDFDTQYWSFRYLQSREAWQVHGGMIRRYHPPLGPGVAQRFDWSSRVTDEQVRGANAFRQALRARWLEVMGHDGVLVLPSMPDVAPLISQGEHELEDYRNQAIRLLSLSGLTGFPQLSLPMATRMDAPLGISLMGPPGSDLSLVRLAQRIMAG